MCVLAAAMWNATSAIRGHWNALANSGAMPPASVKMAQDKPDSLKEGVCPICGATQVKSGADVPEKDGLRGSNRLPINAVFAAPLDNFVCLECGYLESYILDRRILDRIQREWVKVPVQNSAEQT